MFTLNEVCFKNILQISELTIEAKRITCILGESGSGKTTLLKLLNHMVAYNKGCITYRGKDLKSWDPVLLRRDVILLPQAPVIFPGTIRDNLLIGLIYSKKAPVDDDRLLSELHQVGLHKGLDEEAGTLSGGEKQRLALARVMLMSPSVLLLDEPTSALDEDTGETVIAYVKESVKSGDKTLVLVTHSKQLARSIGEKIVTVSGGRIAKIEEVA